MFANRERREFREASDLEFDDDLDSEGFFLLRRGLEILDLEVRAWSLLSSPLNSTTMQNKREIGRIYTFERYEFLGNHHMFGLI